MSQSERSSVFVGFECRCGRSLRAKVDQVGTPVKCWECHELVVVPEPRQNQAMARDLAEGTLAVISGPGMNAVLIAAVFLTIVLAIPIVGTWLAIVALAFLVASHAEMLRQQGHVDEDAPHWLRRILPRSPIKGVLCLGMAAGTVFPLWIRHAGPGVSPRWDWLGRSIALVAWTVLPVLLAIVHEREQGRALDFKRCLRLMSRNRFSMVLALGLIPLVLVVVEVALALIFAIPGNLPFFALDFMPRPITVEEPLFYQGVLYYKLFDFRTLDPMIFIRGYFTGLRHGYSFVGAIPASLANSTRSEMSSDIIGLYPQVYTGVRVLLVLVIVTCLLAAMALQARWLGAIFARERRRPG